MDPKREFRLGDWQVTPLRGVLHRDSETRRLTPRAMDLLLYLVRHHNEVVTRDQLLEDVWHGRAMSDEPLNKSIAEIRRQLGDDRTNPKYIETIPKRGYRMIAAYSPLGDAIDDADDAATGRTSRRLAWITATIIMALVAAVFALQQIRGYDDTRSAPVTVAVLPFSITDSADGLDYFADGMHEELIAALSTIPSMIVRSRSSTLAFRNTTISLPDVARQLDVDVVVTGSVRRSGNSVRISAQLSDAEHDTNLWSGTFEESLTVAELFSIQNRIAVAIGSALELALGPPPQESLAKLPTVDLQAYDHFMLGKYHYRRQLPGDLETAVQNFEAAVQRDPQFAEAWDWLAYAYNHAATSVGYLSPHDAYPKGRAAALRALELKPDLATAVSILGYIRAVYDRDWIGAERDLRRAIELDPDDSGTVWSLAHVLSMLGRYDEAIQLTEDFASRYPDVGRNYLEVANRLIDAGRFDDAMAQLAIAEQHGAEAAQVAGASGIAMLGQGDLNAATQELEFALDAQQRAPDAVARLCFVYARIGRTAEAQALADELDDRSSTEPIPAATLAIERMGMGDPNAALDFLEQAASDRDRAILNLPNDPFFVELHAEPRYQALIAGLAIP